MFKLMGEEINANLGAQTILIWTYGSEEGKDFRDVDVISALIPQAGPKKFHYDTRIHIISKQVNCTIELYTVRCGLQW